MKKKLLVLAFLFVASPVFADITVFNHSNLEDFSGQLKDHVIKVTYHTCLMSENPDVCVNSSSSNPVEITLSAQRGRNYITIPGVFDTRLLFIADKAVELDEVGRIVSEANFLDACRATLIQEENVAIIMNDMNGSPIITCSKSKY